MGQNTSVQETPDVRKYTSAEIETNLKRLFKNNINNNFSEASQSFNVNFTELDQALVGGYNIKFKSSKNRHLNHNIDEFIKKIQSGGDAPISEQSEFAKIKEFLLKEANVNLIGGAIEEDGINYESISSISGFDEFKNTLSQTQEGGGKRKRKHKVMSLANILQSGQLGGDRDKDIDSESDVLDLSEPRDDELSLTSEGEVDIKTANLSPTSMSESRNGGLSSTSEGEVDIKTANLSPTSVSESRNGGLSSTSEGKVNIRTSNLSPTSFSDSGRDNEDEEEQEPESEEQERQSAGFSPTSNQSASSDLNIVPFYSSESSNAHPYTRNRLNK